MTDQQPMGGMMLPRDPTGAALVAREIQQVQGAIISAKMYPRDTGLALKRVENAAARVRLAEQAMYSYTRGGQEITGPSIRLAEVLAQSWGNLDFGFKELDRGFEGGTSYSMVQAFCYDLETNVRRSIEFKVPHLRETRKETKALTSERDIYEFVANQASRRVRNCILSVIPGDIVEAGIEACEKTLASAGTLEEKRKKIVEAFAQVDVSVEEIERRLGKKMTSLSSTDYVQLRKIWKSLHDGASDKTDWFEPVLDPEKIKREQKAGAQAPVAHDDKTKAELHMKALRAEFGKAMAEVMEKGGSPTQILALPMDASEIAKGNTDHPATAIAALAAKLRLWNPQPNPGNSTPG